MINHIYQTSKYSCYDFLSCYELQIDLKIWWNEELKTMIIGWQKIEYEIIVKKKEDESNKSLHLELKVII